MNHTITEASRLANSTCSPRILHARVVSRGILEFFSWKNHPNYSAQLNSFFPRGASCAVSRISVLTL